MKGVTRSRRLRCPPGGAIAHLVVLISLLFYLKTLAPTVLYYDPIEFPDSVVLQIQAIVLGPCGGPRDLRATKLERHKRR